MSHLLPLCRFVLVMAWASSAIAAADPPPWHIMPVGDSITEGGRTFACYRPALQQLLAAAGQQVVFVGSRRSDGPSGPLHHEGYGGRNAEFLATVLAKSLRDHPADVLLIHAGHNHSAEEQPVAGIVTATESMIRIARAANPRMTVLLAQVIPSGKLPKYGYIPALNQALATLAARLHAAERPVILVDQHTGFDWTTDTIDDRVHPNAQGAAKMAARWSAALQPILARPAP